MEELNRQIEEQKQQIRKMAQADSSIGEVIFCGIIDVLYGYHFESFESFALF